MTPTPDNKGTEDMSTVPQSTEPLVDRVRFDIIGKTESGHELRAWTDGDRVVWEDDEGRSGYMPAMLFRLAAMTLARVCEEIAMGDPNDPGEGSDVHDDFMDRWSDSLKSPIELAMANPYWRDPDHPANDLRFGFASLAVNTAIDVQPNGLRARAEFTSGGKSDTEPTHQELIAFLEAEAARARRDHGRDPHASPRDGAGASIATSTDVVRDRTADATCGEDTMSTPDTLIADLRRAVSEYECVYDSCGGCIPENDCYDACMETVLAAREELDKHIRTALPSILARLEALKGPNE